MKLWKKTGLLFLAVMCLFVSGCGAKVQVTVNKDLSVDEKSQYYLTPEEISKLVDKLGSDMVEEPFHKVTINGTQYCRVMQDSMHYKPGLAVDVFTELNKKYAVITNAQLEDITEGEDNLLLEGGNPIQFADACVTFPYPIYYTNGKLQEDGKTVEFDLLKAREGEPLYVVFDKNVYKVNEVEISGVKNKKIYNKYKNIVIKTEGVIKKIDVVEKESFAKPEEAPISTDGYKNWYFGGDGVYKINVMLINGKTVKTEFTIDTMPPKTNVKNKTYKKSVKITFSDKNSGMKSAKLNGKTIKSGKKINKPGSYKLVLTDKAGNTTKIKFKVR